MVAATELEELRAENERLRAAVAGLRRLLTDSRRERGTIRARPRAVCPVCGRDVAVREDGTLRLHSVPGGDARARVQTCEGSLLPPGDP